MCPAPDASAASSGSLTGQPSPTPVRADSLIPLIAALQAQTEALNRLAASNEGLTNAVASLIEEMAEDHQDPEDMDAPQYMNERKVR